VQRSTVLTGHTLNRITAESVESFKLARAAESGGHTRRRLRPATVNRELACLKAVFNHAIKGDANLRNPVSRVKFLAEQNDQNRVVSYIEQEAYLKKATATLRDVATLIVETGMRPEQVFNLKRDDVNPSWEDACRAPSHFAHKGGCSDAKGLSRHFRGLTIRLK
jgi:site-specific recombinase XerD